MTSSFSPDPRGVREFVANPLPRPTHGFRGGRAVPPAAELAAPDEPPSDPDELLRQSYERGREAGRAELPWKEAEALQSAQLALERAACALDEDHRATLRAQREAVIEMALAVARQILEHEVSARLDDLEPQLERALTLMAQAGPVVLHLAPGDLETLQAGGAPALERLAGSALAGIQANAELRPGDARLSAGSTGVDIRIETMLAQFRNELRGMVSLEEEAK